MLPDADPRPTISMSTAATTAGINQALEGDLTLRLAGSVTDRTAETLISISRRRSVLLGPVDWWYAYVAMAAVVIVSPLRASDSYVWSPSTSRRCANAVLMSG